MGFRCVNLLCIYEAPMTFKGVVDADAAGVQHKPIVISTFLLTLRGG